jgi:hypothetical protein
MVDVHAALLHQLFQVPVAERISQVPANTGQDNIFFDAVPFEVDHVVNLSSIG